MAFWNRILGGNVSSAVRSFGRDFIASFAAHVVAEGGQPRQVSGTVVGQTVQALGSQLRGTWFGLDAEDEASFTQALSLLEPDQAAVIIRRVRALGDPQVEDTPEARTFRKVLIQLQDAEARAAVLRFCATLSDQDFDQMVKITGSATAGQVAQWLRMVKKGLPIALQYLKAIDQGAAANVDHLAQQVSGTWARIKQA